MSRDLEPPRSMSTYRRADGELIGNDYGWVTDPDVFEDDDEPREYVREDWILSSRKTLWIPDYAPCQECGENVALPADYDSEMLLTCLECLDDPHITEGANLP